MDVIPAENFFAMLARRFYDAERDQQLHARNRVDIQYKYGFPAFNWKRVAHITSASMR